jgi:hypothetical protein
MTIVTLPEVQQHLDLTDHDDELTLLLEEADAKIDDLAGPVIARTVTETVVVRNGYALLSSVPLEITGVTGSNGVALTGWTTDDIGGIGGLRAAPAGFLTSGEYGTAVTVEYVAGRVAAGDPVPARFKRAALRYIGWAWRREHGGSDTYMPDGDGTSTALGVAGIEKELRFILGKSVRVGSIL